MSAPGPVERSFAVDGMTCRACEVRVQRAVGRVGGVTAAYADAARGRLVVRSTRPVPDADVAAALARLGGDYRLGRAARPWLTADREVWRDLALAVVGVLALIFVLDTLGLTTLADRVGGAASSGSLAVIVLLGIAAGFSTCMALVGGLVLALSARSADPDAGAPGRPGVGGWVPQVWFNAGRIGGFALLGALTGVLGGAVTLSGTGLAVAMLVAAVVMTAVGVQLSGASPRLGAGLLPALPDLLSARLERIAGGPGAAAAPVRRAAGAGLAGAATYFLPCGFTQAVQLYALSTGSPGRAAAIMAAFAVGTAPGLLAIGGLGARLRGTRAQRLSRFAAVVVLAFAVINAQAALGVLTGGSVGTARAAAPAGVSENVRLADGVQYVTTTQVADGYEPADAVVVAGVPVVWQVASEALTCASWLRAPGLGDADGAVLSPGETSEFRFTPAEAGVLPFSCGMGMYWGSFRVIDAPPEQAGAGSGAAAG